MKNKEFGATRIVVGDNFKEFCDIDISQRVVTASEATRLIKSGKHHGICFIPGQGLSKKSEDELFKIAFRYDAMSCFGIWLENSSQARAGRKYSHKHLARNQIISMPRKLSNGTFCCDVLIDEKNEFMVDHKTGTHVQGMLIVEAARQMFISVGEVFLGGESIPKDGYFVIDYMNFEFINFVFPLSIRVAMLINGIDKKNKHKTKVDTNIKFFQNGSVVAQCKIGFSVLGEKIFQRMENKLARSSVNQFISDTLLESEIRPKEQAGYLQA